MGDRIHGACGDSSRRAVAITAVAYIAASRQDIDATTEVSALVVLAAGVLAGIGAFRLASAIIALETLLLVEKSRLHALVQRIDDTGLRSGVRFAVMALVILPLLPEGPYGPFGGFRPRELWMLVLFFSALSFLGYVARRIAGPGHGYLATGFLGGLVSSTNVTFTFARLSRREAAVERALAFGAVAGNAVLYPRVVVATAVLNPDLVPVADPLPDRSGNRRGLWPRPGAVPARASRSRRKCRRTILSSSGPRCRWPVCFKGC